MLLGALVAVVELQARSPWLVLAAMAIVWIADTAAYFAGHRFGRHKLAPRISPGKTWEGVLGGVAAVIVYALALLPFAPAAGYSGSLGPRSVALVGRVQLALAALSIVGDLHESLLKRRAGVEGQRRAAARAWRRSRSHRCAAGGDAAAALAALLFLARP